MFNNAPRKIRITSLTLAERGAYPLQYRREFQTNCTQETLEHPTNAGLIGYSARAIEAYMIPNGWDTSRLAFHMEGEVDMPVGGVIMFSIDGYTSHVGVGENGGFDPSMDFIINSTSTRRKTFETTPNGPIEHMQLVASDQVFSNSAWRGIHEPHMTKVRPEDVYAAMTRSHLTDLADVVDLRTIVDVKPIFGSRRHQIPAHYVQDIVTGYKRAQLDASFGIQQEEDILENARGYMQSNFASNHPFFRALNNVRDGFLSNLFTWSDLMAIDPNVADVTTVTTKGKTESAIKLPEYESWAVPDLTTLTAWTLVQGVTSIMDTLGIQRINFSSTNGLPKDQRLLAPTLEHDVSIGLCVSRDYDDVQSLLLGAFRNRLQQFVLSEISMNGHLDYRVYVSADMYGDTKVEISLGGSERKIYRVPTFADALFSPLVMTGDHRRLVHDLENMLHYHSEFLKTGLNAIANEPAPGNTFGAI